MPNGWINQKDGVSKFKIRARAIFSSCSTDKPPRMHRRTYGRLFNKAEAEQERRIALSSDYLRRRFPGGSRDETSS